MIQILISNDLAKSEFKYLLLGGQLDVTVRRFGFIPSTMRCFIDTFNSTRYFEGYPALSKMLWHCKRNSIDLLNVIKLFH